MPRMLAGTFFLSMTNQQTLESADDQFDRSLALAVVRRGDKNLRQMMTRTPGSTIDGLHLQQVGTGADISEGSDVVAEWSLLPGNLEVLHEGEVILRQIGDGPAGAADEHENVRGVRVAVRGGSCGRLSGDRERSGATRAGLHDDFRCWRWNRLGRRRFEHRLQHRGRFRIFHRRGRGAFGKSCFGFGHRRLFGRNRFLSGWGCFFRGSRLLFGNRLFSRCFFGSRFLGHGGSRF